MKIMRNLVQIFAGFLTTLFIPTYIYAAPPEPTTGSLPGATPGSLSPHLTSLVGVFGVIIGLLYDFVAIAMFVILTINGFKYLFSGVNPDQKAAASKGLMYAFIGLFIIAISYMLVVILVGFVSPQFQSHIFNGSALNFNLTGF